MIVVKRGIKLDNNYLLELRNITKVFPGVTALSEVDFNISKGEIVALVGANGAGKSTLSNIISGVDTPTGGSILVDGSPVSITDANIAETLGIEMVHQEPTLVPNMTVTANIFLNREIKRGQFLDKEEMRKAVEEIFDLLGFVINPEKRIIQLTLVEKTAVEIAKALLSKPRLLILDEVTAPFDDKEVKRLFEIMRELKAKGMAILFIDHKMHEIVEIADRVVIIRDGQNAGELSELEISERAMIDMMLGTTGKFVAAVNTGRQDLNRKTVFSAKNLSNSKFFQDMSFEVKQGEILGFAGLKGAGITELFKTIFGLMPEYNGELFVHGKPVSVKKPLESIEYGIGFISNDRQKEGLALIRSVGDNITISSLADIKNKSGFINSKRFVSMSKEYIDALQIKTPSYKQLVRNLSGGNQQKIVIAKWLARNLDILIFDEPTRGVDIHAKNEIYKLMLAQKEHGKAIMVTSPEVPELLNMCDRILIVVQGQVVKEISKTEPDYNENYILEQIHSYS